MKSTKKEHIHWAQCAQIYLIWNEFSYISFSYRRFFLQFDAQRTSILKIGYSIYELTSH